MQVEILEAVHKFRVSLESDAQGHFYRVIELLVEHGRRLHMPHSKQIDRELFELRILGKRSVRIIYGLYNSKAYLLHAFNKKSHRIRPRDTALARKRLECLQEI